MFVKVCGITTKEQIDWAIEYGYDAIGVVTYKDSKRYCTSEQAIELAKYVNGKLKTFVVGLSYDDVKPFIEYFDTIQVYEDIKEKNFAFSSKEKPKSDMSYEYFIFDASVGQGVFSTYPKWLYDFGDNLIVAGGLNKTNVNSVIEDIKPYGVDVSSGVEVNGTKNRTKMKEFISKINSRASS